MTTFTSQIIHNDIPIFCNGDIHNPSQNNWRKKKKYSKIGQDVKNVISTFACFLTAIVNV